MKSLYFCAVLLTLPVSWLASDSLLANQSYANHNISGKNSVISQTPARGESFIVNGTEPFWNVTVNRNGIVYSSPEVSKRNYPYVTPMKAEGRPADLVRVYQLRGQPNGTLIIKKAESCSDGMSDNIYPYEATLILGNRVLEGCASRK
ncbi:COG3650 family protein [Aerosakkonemataceae cyanobacterium BLCC-F154]|uniref:COG3650 family protein n=1 Tax=Floridaenema fluviatile BLCC-F154 TaxID=3153640 RepID=A0ABV4YDW7_9CYAN